MNKEIEIPEGYEAKIENNRVIFVPKDGEDERIRKWLIEMVEELRKANPTNAEHNGNCSEAIAYLEKQKENIEKEYVFRPLAGTDIAIAAEQAIRRAKEGEHLVLAFNGIYMPVSKYDSAKGLVNKYNTYLKEQNPVERSLEDDHIIGFVYDLLNEIEWNDNWAMSKEECLRLLNNYSPQQPAEWNDEDEELAEELIKLAEYYTDTEDETEFKPHISWLKTLPERFGLQPKQEWSEEDEKRIQRICDFLWKNRKGDTDTIYQIEKDVDWLKFLRPSWNPSEQEKQALRTAIHVLTEERNFPRAANQLQNILNVFEGKSRRDWKPSEEQMKSLKSCVYGGLFKMEVLQELYNDLLEKL